MPSSAGSDSPLESPRSTGTFGRLFRRFTRRSTDVDGPDTPASTSTSTILSGAGTPAASSSTVDSRQEDGRHRRGGSTSVSDTIRGLGREFGGLSVKDAGLSRGEGSSAQAATSTGVSRFMSQDYSTRHTSSNSYAGASSSQQNARTPSMPYAGSTTSSPLSPATSSAYAGGSTGVSRSMSLDGPDTSRMTNASAYMQSTSHAGASSTPQSTSHRYTGNQGAHSPTTSYGGAYASASQQNARSPTSPYASSTTSSPLSPATTYMYTGTPARITRSMSAEGSTSNAYMDSIPHTDASPPPPSNIYRTTSSRNQGIQTPPSTTYSPSPAIMYLDSHPSTPYTYPQQTPQPQSYSFYSPAPLSPTPLSPSTEVDQPTLAGRIQSLLDSINVFSRSEADSSSSSTSSSSTPTMRPHEHLSPSTNNLPMSPRRRYDADVLPDTSSIMVYSPLLPTDMDLVELAETVPFGMPSTPGPVPPSPLPVVAPESERQEQGQEEVQVYMQPSSNTGAGSGAGWSSWWPFNAFSSWSQPSPSPSSNHQSPIPVIYTPRPTHSPLPYQRNTNAFWEHHTPASTARLELLPNSPFGGQTPLPNVYTPLPDEYTPLPNEYTPLPPNSPLLSPGPQLVPLDLPQEGGRGGDGVQPQQRIWVPSKTMLSIQAMWWGYRLYVPPPLMHTLSSASISAARRSAILTSALTWFFNNLPLALLPVPLQPLLVLLQSLSPLVALVGGAIAGLWSVVEGYDVGYGIILTATWLMPIALVPSTWTQEEWPVSPPLQTRELHPEGPTSLDAMVARTRSESSQNDLRNGLPTPPASANGLPSPPPSSGNSSTPASPLNTHSPLTSPRSDAVSPPASPRSNLSSAPSSPGSVWSGTLTPTLTMSPMMSPGLSVGFVGGTPVLGAGPLPYGLSPMGQLRVEENGNSPSSPEFGRRDRAPASPESGIYIPSPPASPVRSAGALGSPYPSAAANANANGGGYVPPSPSLSHYSPSAVAGTGYALPFTYAGDGSAGGLYPCASNSPRYPATSSPLPGAHDVPPSSPYASPQMMLSPLSVYLYTSPPARTSPLPALFSPAQSLSPLPTPSPLPPLPPPSPSNSASSYYSAHTPTQGYYSLSPSSPANVYSTADEATPRPREAALPSPSPGHSIPASPASVYPSAEQTPGAREAGLNPPGNSTPTSPVSVYSAGDQTPRPCEAGLHSPGHSTPASPTSVYSTAEQTPRPIEAGLHSGGAGTSTPSSKHSRASRDGRKRARRKDRSVQGTPRTGQASSQVSPYHSPAPAMDVQAASRSTLRSPYSTSPAAGIHTTPQNGQLPLYAANAQSNPRNVDDGNTQPGYAPSPPSSIPSPLPFSPPVGYGFSAFGVSPSPAQSTRGELGSRAMKSNGEVVSDTVLEKELLRAPTLGSVPLPEVDAVHEGERRAKRRDRRR